MMHDDNETGDSGDPAALEFSVWRLDDNSNEFLVREKMTEDDARRLVREYEGKGHKQAYWVKRGASVRPCNY